MMRKIPFFLLLLFLIPAASTMNVSAEADAGLEELGITMVALRNDTLDLNQDGDVDAVRVVVILNSTMESIYIDVRLIATHNDREVIESSTIEVVGQTNASLTYDARLIEAMEAAGLVSEMNTNGTREVLVPKR